jgi:hypothetical protein
MRRNAWWPGSIGGGGGCWTYSCSTSPAPSELPSRAAAALGTPVEPPRREATVGAYQQHSYVRSVRLSSLLAVCPASALNLTRRLSLTLPLVSSAACPRDVGRSVSVTLPPVFKTIGLT